MKLVADTASREHILGEEKHQKKNTRTRGKIETKRRDKSGQDCSGWHKSSPGHAIPWHAYDPSGPPTLAGQQPGARPLPNRPPPPSRTRGRRSHHTHGAAARSPYFLRTTTRASEPATTDRYDRVRPPSGDEPCEMRLGPAPISAAGWTPGFRHYRKRHVCRVPDCLPCAKRRAHGKHIICRVSQAQHTAKYRTHGKVHLCRVPG